MKYLDVLLTCSFKEKNSYQLETATISARLLRAVEHFERKRGRGTLSDGDGHMPSVPGLSHDTESTSLGQHPMPYRWFIGFVQGRKKFQIWFDCLDFQQQSQLLLFSLSVIFLLRSGSHCGY